MRKLTLIILCGIIAFAVNAEAAGRRSDDSSRSSSKSTQSYSPSTAAKTQSPSYTPARPSTPERSSYSRGDYRPATPVETRPSAPAVSSAPARPSTPERSTYSRGDYRPATPVETRPVPPTVSSAPARSPYPTSSYRPDSSTDQRGDQSTRDKSRPSTVNSKQRPDSSRTSEIRDHGPDRLADAPKPAGAMTYQSGTSASARQDYKPHQPNSQQTRPSVTDNRNTQRPDSSRLAPKPTPSKGYQPHQSFRDNPTQRNYKPAIDKQRPTGALSYRPSLPRVNYTVGYKPAARYYVPTTYRPPTYRQGFYYYPVTYYNEPCYFGYWSSVYAPGFSYRSVYYSFGLFPFFQVTRIVTRPYTVVNYVSEPLYVSSYIEPTAKYSRFDETLADIRSGWISGRYDLIERHVRDDRDIAILLDGKYDYSIVGEDYLAMTRDALGDLDTSGFVWSKVRERGDGMVTAFGEHSFYSGDRIRTVYVSYTFQKVGSSYYIVEVGSSEFRLD